MGYAPALGWAELCAHTFRIIVRTGRNKRLQGMLKRGRQS